MLDETSFYQRQSILSEIGPSGQKSLKEASVAIIGAGGLGHPVASYLAAAGVGKILLVDDDVIEGGNLNRQFLFTPVEVGESKSKILRHRIKAQNPFIEVEALCLRLTLDNCNSIIFDYDLVLDCTDNFVTKFLLHDACYFLKKDLIQASIYQFEGQLQNFLYSREEVREGGCLRCLWPEVPKAGCVGNCAEAGVVGAVAGSMGTLQAMEAIKVIVGLDVLTANTTLTFDLVNFQLHKFKWKKKDECPLCNNSSVTLDGISAQKVGEYEISSTDLTGFKCIDVRENDTTYLYLDVVENAQKNKEKVLFVCNKGVKSLVVTKYFRALGFENTWSLFGGMERVKDVKFSS